MSLTLPNLDDRSWDELVAEGRSLIRSWAPDWTNHNAADPGITLIELFAYLSELLMYRLNQIGDKNLRVFLKLINGPDWMPGENLQADKRRTLQNLFRTRRAVSCADFESLALAVNEKLELNARKVARVKCIPRSNLSSDRNIAQTRFPGHVSVIVVAEGHAQADTSLLNQVSEALESARLLTTQVHVVVPLYVTLGVRLTVVVKRYAIAEQVRRDAVECLRRFLDSLEGGTDGTGWPFGRSVYVSEIYEQVGTVPGVNYVTRTIDPATHSPMDELLVSPAEAWRVKRNRVGRLEAIELWPDELVAPWIDEDDITVIA